MMIDSKNNVIHLLSVPVGLWPCGPAGLWACGPVGLRACGPVGLWSAGLWACGPAELRAYRPVGLWNCGPVAPWTCGPVGLRACGPGIVEERDALVLGGVWQLCTSGPWTRLDWIGAINKKLCK